MPPGASRHLAGWLVLVLVLTSMPARVWLFGACPVCGTIHRPVLVAVLGDDPDAPLPDDADDDAEVFHTCHPPLPHAPTTDPAAAPHAVASAGELRPPLAPAPLAVPFPTPIRPPRA